MQAKRILNFSDLVDNRNWFVSRFNKAEASQTKAQALIIKKFDINEIKNVREKHNHINKSDSLN
jgi:hypothetical protein